MSTIIIFWLQKWEEMRQGVGGSRTWKDTFCVFGAVAAAAAPSIIPCTYVFSLFLNLSHLRVTWYESGSLPALPEKNTVVFPKTFSPPRYEWEGKVREGGPLLCGRIRAKQSRVVCYYRRVVKCWIFFRFFFHDLKNLWVMIRNEIQK